jgi:hypothetical protein
VRLHEAIPCEDAQLAVDRENTAIDPLDNGFRQIRFHREGP